MQTHFANWNVIKHIGEIPWPYPSDGARSYISRMLEESECKEIYYWGIFLKVNPTELIGTIEYRFLDDDDENRGFWLSEDYWGNGIMTDAVTVTQDFIFFELKKPRLLVRNRSTNDASKAVKEKTGARLIGSDKGSYYDGKQDEDVWEVTRESWELLRKKHE